jgi:predicted nucleic acid-binding protein
MRGQFTSLIPEIVLAETAYLFRRETAAGDLAFLKALQIFKPELVSLSYIDLERALEIRVHYQHFNFVDCCIMAQAERLNITHICTLDMRDFSQFRPRHIPFFVLLPAMLPE